MDVVHTVHGVLNNMLVASLGFRDSKPILWLRHAGKHRIRHLDVITLLSTK